MKVLAVMVDVAVWLIGLFLVSSLFAGVMKVVGTAIFYGVALVACQRVGV